MARSSGSVGGGQTGGGKGIVIPEWDAIFGKVPEVDPNAMTGGEIRAKYRMGAGQCFDLIREKVASGELEVVRKELNGRITKAYRPTKKGGKR